MFCKTSLCSFPLSCTIYSDDFQSVTRDGRCVYSSSLETFHNFKDDTLQSRLGRTSVGDSVRPMTATGGAGFQSRSKFSLTIHVA